MLTAVTSGAWPLKAISWTACAGWKPCVFLAAVKPKPKISAWRRRISVSGQWKCYVWRFFRLAYWNSSPPCRLLVAVYFGFSYLGELDFGHYGTGVTLSAGFLALILAPEFFQPLRDLGTFTTPKHRPWVPLTA
jgi:hypothetical protein